MLQQTQVDRVIPKYEAFLARFPDFQSLARASVADALREWQGLGYNSRAVRLKRLACAVVDRYDGKLPKGREQLLELKGVGPYTASAVRAFAFDLDDAAIDTNMRRVVGRLLYGVASPATRPAQLNAGARALLPRGKAYDWNSAIMDLGAAICLPRKPHCVTCPLAPVCAAAPCEPQALERPIRRSPAPVFELTTRHARGRIIDRLRELPAARRISLLDLHRELETALGRSREEFESIVGALVRDGLVEIQSEQVALSEER